MGWRLPSPFHSVKRRSEPRYEADWAIGRGYVVEKIGAGDRGRTGDSPAWESQRRLHIKAMASTAANTDPLGFSNLLPLLRLQPLNVVEMECRSTHPRDPTPVRRDRELAGPSTSHPASLLCEGPVLLSTGIAGGWANGRTPLRYGNVVQRAQARFSPRGSPQSDHSHLHNLPTSKRSFSGDAQLAP
jgi:hypothetical protein